ncbi:hypothetical protein [Pantoea sp.]|uniref:hypothetical protein n=1 Tax=Pantoea sp. TaxID=69393 RepID=UPI00290EBC54|nr:hypothetical protein [Pantoea sp.]MDU4127989.1 hypothetical protein [Pantoea sp.]
MKIGQVYTSLKTDTDIIALSASDTFAIKKAQVANLAINIEPGSVILADGSALVAGSAAAGTPFLISLDYVEAGANKTFRAVDRLVVVNPDSLVYSGADRDGVIALITADGNIRVTTQTHVSIPTT